MGMISPLLPIAVAAQVLMGTVFVYTVKFASDLNAFYSLGDSDLYLKMTAYGKYAEAMGGCVGSFAGPFIYDSVSPYFPFVVSLCLSCCVFIIFTGAFASRVGWEDIETAEAMRSRRLGLTRQSCWSFQSRKTQEFDVENLDC